MGEPRAARKPTVLTKREMLNGRVHEAAVKGHLRPTASQVAAALTPG